MRVVKIRIAEICQRWMDLPCRWVSAVSGGGRDDAPNVSGRQVPLVWRAPEGLAAVPVGGGGAWPWCPLAAAKTVSNKCRT